MAASLPPVTEAYFTIKAAHDLAQAGCAQAKHKAKIGERVAVVFASDDEDAQDALMAEESAIETAHRIWEWKDALAAAEDALIDWAIALVKADLPNRPEWAEIERALPVMRRPGRNRAALIALCLKLHNPTL